MFNMVAEFHRTFGVLIGETPALPDASVTAFRRRLLDEEWNEYLEAEEANDYIEVADALADMAYIICGTLVSYGSAPKTAFMPPSVTRTNLPPEFPAAQLRQDRINCLKEAYERYLIAEENLDLKAIDMACFEMLNAIGQTSTMYGFYLKDVFEEFQRSNMSKLDENGKPIYRKSDGKVLKSHLFSPPDLQSVIFGKLNTQTKQSM